MQQAIFHAQQALNDGEVPIGAVLVNSEGQELAFGYNQSIKRSDPTAHAEIQCLRLACTALQNYRLPDGCCLYVTLEPCVMCMGALLHARLSNIVIATRDTRKNSIHRDINLFQSSYFNHKINAFYGCLENEAKELLNKFFMERR